MPSQNILTLRIQCLPNFTSIPRTACWSALFMMSETDAEVGKHKVCTLILRSPFAEV